MNTSERKRPELTIGMPVYNGEKYIREALDSLLKQSFRDFELIISDNASIDGTQAICQSYLDRDPRIRYVRQPANLGALKNFCFVLQEANAQYFMWAACDDIWSADWVEVLFKKIRGQERCAAFGTLQHINENSQAIPHQANRQIYTYSGQTLRGRVRFFLDFEGRGKANLFYAIYPTKILSDFDFSSHDTDYLILFDLLKSTSFLSEETILYKRIHASSEAAGQEMSKKSKRSQMRKIISFSWLWRDWNITNRYIKQSTGMESVAFLLLAPIKIAINAKFHFLRILRNTFPKHAS
jgi:glycosyltransferase involved in cell wall biosynthesis